MTIISTNFGSFKITYDEQEPNRVMVINPSTDKPLMVITDTHWWDKDGITRSLYKNKARILKRISEQFIHKNRFIKIDGREVSVFTNICVAVVQ